MESDYSDRDWLWQSRQDGRISPAMAQQVHERLCALEARLAVLGKVEEMIPKQFFNLIVSPLRDGGFNVSLYNWDAEVEERECEGKTLIEAFTALIDGKEGG